MKLRLPKGKLFLLITGLVILLFITVLGALFVAYKEGYFVKLLPASYANVSVDQGKVKVVLFIQQKDMAFYKGFLQNLNLSDNRSFELALDDQTTNFLSNVSPARVNLDFISDKDLKFQTVKLPSFESSIPGKDFDFATKSATIHITYQDEKDYQLKAKDPGVLLEEATKSGKLYLSSKILSVFSSLSKVATIVLTTQSGALSGEVQLK